MKQIQIGLFGFGVVGEGIFQVLNAKKQLGATIKKVVIKDPLKPRNGPSELFSTDPSDIFNDPEIDLVVELINDSTAAYTIVKAALESGRSVISANKKLIAENGQELITLAASKKLSFLYEAAVCGSIPVIRNLEEYFDNDLVSSVEGIVNGSTNYILSKMESEGSSYGNALKEAQNLGYAESDPTLDVEGWDAAHKLQIIAMHAFGINVSSRHILRKGISSLSEFDLRFAKEKGLSIKLIASAIQDEESVAEKLSVVPTFVSSGSSLGLTKEAFNGVQVTGALADQQFFHGKGAGRYPTSSAVLSDISAYRYNYRYEYKKGRKEVTGVNRRNGIFYISGHDPFYKVSPEHWKIIEELQSGNRWYVIAEIPASELEYLYDQHGWSIIEITELSGEVFLELRELSGRDVYQPELSTSN